MLQVACDRMRDIPVPDREVPGPGQARLAAGSSPRAHSSHGRSATSPEVSLVSLVYNPPPIHFYIRLHAGMG